MPNPLRFRSLDLEFRVCRVVPKVFEGGASGSALAGKVSLTFIDLSLWLSGKTVPCTTAESSLESPTRHYSFREPS